MKRLVLLTAILIGLIEVSGQNYDISVYAEPQIAWITSNQGGVTADGSILHINTGIELDLYFAKNYAFSMGVCMNNFGGKLMYVNPISFVQNGDSLNIPGGSSLKHNLQYVGIPLGLKLKSEELGYTTFYFHGGFIPMINMGARTSSETLGFRRRNIQADINVFNLNYFIEAGIEYRLGGNTALKAGLKWSAGVTDVTRNDPSANNLSSVGVLLGVLF